MEFLVSIIIPTYNRAHLIGETLDSIIGQTYSNWECIVVDDGSSDNTNEILNFYCNKDKRISYIQRPDNRVKGANTCRNYGFELSKGKYVNWFDSDDIMLPEHILVLVTTLEKRNVDFVVGDSVDFKEGIEEKIQSYTFDRSKNEMTPFLFATHQIGWITDDFLGKREMLLRVLFNETLSANQEYNYFIRLLHYKFKGVFVNQILSWRRLHSQSITTRKIENKQIYFKVICDIKYQTAQDLVTYNNHELIRWFLSGYMKNAFEMAVLKQTIPYKMEAFKLICRYFSVFKGVAYIVALLLARYSKKGYVIMKYARS
ncbi:glycosyltransferase family 2 protein [Flavobacterium degerlachei]|jgi:glycosyltransferase involved in cell wall biosynthesis|uniref:Glycosyltransferase involved in cell wall bisynthesis n=1 Tax=Flavobacterium degerlachei TaxID=229203 RepID=A0A1H2VUS0_9FLAO|nr:glycosyltransferase family 2 protein [Flavobacterium degerlachei]SDW72098.1 Glycosyltransferase involved in cell wall bisynthesis [Flavobacterium degerlachei]